MKVVIFSTKRHPHSENPITHTFQHYVSYRTKELGWGLGMRPPNNEELGWGLGMGLPNNEELGWGLGMGLPNNEELGWGLGTRLPNNEGLGWGLGMRPPNNEELGWGLGMRLPNNEELGWGLGMRLPKGIVQAATLTHSIRQSAHITEVRVAYCLVFYSFCCSEPPGTLMHN